MSAVLGRRGRREPIYSVMAPSSDPVVEGPAPTPPLVDLNDKTICELWDGIFRGDAMFPIIRDELRRRFPRLRFIGYGSFGDIYADRGSGVSRDLASRLGAHGCDAVIAGVGG